MSSISHLDNRLLQSLPAAEFDALHPHLKIVELAREAVLAEAGAPLAHVYLPHSGIISLVVRLSEGQTVEVGMIGRDSVFGAAAALDGGISLTDAAVLLSGTASMIELAHFRAVADRNAGFRTLLIRHEQALYVQARQAVACNAHHSIEARLARWLLHAHDLNNDENLPLTQEFLAQMIGVQRNSISFVAHALQQAGILSYSRGHIQITNLQGLRETACECYAAIATQYQRLIEPPGAAARR